MKIKTLILLSTLFCPIAFADADIKNNGDTIQLKTNKIQWLKKPFLDFTNEDLEGQNRNALAMFVANEQGIITQVELKNSTGLLALDQKIIRALKTARIQPYKKNDENVSIFIQLPLTLNLREIHDGQSYPSSEYPLCKIKLSSEIEKSYKKGLKVPFQYLNFPNTLLFPAKHLGYFDNNQVKISLKIAKNKTVYPDIKVIKSTGSYYIDYKLKLLLESRLVKTQNDLIPFLKITTTDQIELDISDCEKTINNLK